MINDAPGLRTVTKGRTVEADGRRGVVTKANPRSCLVRWDGDRYTRAHDCNEVTVVDLRSSPTKPA